MGTYRDETGRILELDDKFAEARGYAPVSPAEQTGLLDKQIEEKRAEDRGLLGTVNAGATRFANALTLGGTDYALGQALSPIERENLLGDIQAHPYVSAGANIAGAAVGALAAPESLAAKTPAGYLGSLAAREIETGLERGGIAGTARALNAMGVEGAAQSVGQYIGASSLEDKDLSAEGLAGSLGSGYAFAAVGGGAALGISKATVAARRLVARAAQGEKAAAQAESSWTLARQAALDADEANAAAAQKRVDDVASAKTGAMRERNEAKAYTREEQMRASATEGRAAVTEDGTIIAPEASGPVGPEPLDAGIAPATKSEGAKTQVRGRPIEQEGPAPLAEVGPQTGPGGVTSKYEAPRPSDLASGNVTKKIVRGPAELPTAEETALERQLAGTKKAVDEGVELKNIKANKGNESASIEGWLAEEAAARAKARSAETLSDIRYNTTEDMLGAPVAKAEREVVEALEEWKAAKKDLGTLSDGVPMPIDDVEMPAPPPIGTPNKGNATAVRSPGRRQAVEILDKAHEEALLRAKFAHDPAEADAAFHEASEAERMLDDVSDGIPRQYASDSLGHDLVADIEKIWRYEQASAKLSDVVGDAAHPTSVMRAKALREAEREAERKMYDRAARGVDDAEFVGPAYKTPKERVQYAREQQNAAQAKVEELSVQEREANLELGKANRKVREGQAEKKGILRDEAKAARATQREGNAAAVGGLLEFANIPGLPKPSDIPVIGPLLGAYLKFRAIKRGIGMLRGRVPATANAQVAVRVAQTRDRIARAVDRSLGLLEKTGAYAARVVPPAAGALAARIYDDGGEDPGPKAPIQAQAAARMRELAAYVHTPNAIEIDVRRGLANVADPDLIAAAEKHRRALLEYLLKFAPPMPEQGIIKTTNWQPSPGESMAFARRLAAANDPAGVIERLGQDDFVSVEAAQTFRDIYPKLFQDAVNRAIQRAGEPGVKVPLRQRIQMSVFFQMPFEAALNPENFQITQSVYDRKPSSPAYTPSVPGAAPAAPTAQPAIANPVNISQQMTTSLDRR